MAGNEVLGNCRSASSITRSAWIDVCLDLGLTRWRPVTNRLRVFSLCSVLYVYLYVRVYVTFKWNRLDTHTRTHDAYTCLVSLNFSRKLFDMS